MYVAAMFVGRQQLWQFGLLAIVTTEMSLSLEKPIILSSGDLKMIYALINSF
jgi:hypothetical protein